MNRKFLLMMALLIPTSVFAQQFLPVKGIVNARDLGGYTMLDGRIVQSGRLLRAAHLADATDEDIRNLERLPVTAVIDFRKEQEKVGKVDREVPGARYVSLPVDPSGNAMATATEEEKKKFSGRKKFDVKKVIVFAAFNKKAQAVAQKMYPTLLFDPDCQQQFARFFRLVLETENGAVLFHCTQGKDRTGIASALLLAALGADRETIVADFDATNRVYEKDVRKYSRRVKFWGGKEEEVGVVKAFLGCNTENFIKALDRIDQEFGSLQAYLKGPIGLTDADIQTLRERYLAR
ncbi:MAG: tyrosine-protein phosphatase [Bacteroidales bacterium]|nr:tyrosine-protein phosphatase [Bacteroidales bacterium]